jgi:hypothetical protein
LKQDVVEIRASIGNLNSRMTSFENSLSTIIQMQGSQQSEIEALKKSLKEVSTGKEEAIREMEARDQRRLNLIVSGVGEKSDGTVDERKAFDEECVTQLFREIGLSDVSLRDVRRIGNVQQSKSRLIRITCSNVDEKNSILRNARRLRSVSRYKNVFINTDLTPMQQKKHKALRDELKRRRNAGENVRIRSGEVVHADNQNFR